MLSLCHTLTNLPLCVIFLRRFPLYRVTFALCANLSPPVVLSCHPCLSVVLVCHFASAVSSLSCCYVDVHFARSICICYGTPHTLLQYLLLRHAVSPCHFILHADFPIYFSLSFHATGPYAFSCILLSFDTFVFPLFFSFMPSTLVSSF